MIYLETNNLSNYHYDITSLIKSFYPKEDLIQNNIKNDVSLSKEDIKIILDSKRESKDLEKVEMLINDERFSETILINDGKNELKKFIYRVLSDRTKTVLPWGTLTGIRPTKITTDFIKNIDQPEKIFQKVYEYLDKNYYISNEKANLLTDISLTEEKILKGIDYENGYSLYVGIPFCPSKCSYCSFTSYPISRYLNKTDSYLDALIKEIEIISKHLKGKKLNSVYVGGGTPTTLNEVQLDRLLTAIEVNFDLTYNKEITVEAGRPDSITREKLEVIKKHKIKRISINPQTMKEETLKIIGRHHSIKQVIESYKLARELNFSINMDLIIGLPDETTEDVKNTLEEIKKLNPDSITIHSLALKRAANLITNKEKYKDYIYTNNQEIMDMTIACSKELNMKPYYLYRQKNMAGNMENVGYSKEGHACIYNILIMEDRQDIVALGAGGVSKFIDKKNGNITRVDNVKDVDLYIEKIDEMIKRKTEILL